MTAGRLRPAPWPVLPCLAALLAVRPAPGTPAFEARLERGLEYHSLSSLLSSARALGADTLRLSLGFEGRRGFRDWNRESSRLSQTTQLGWERPAGPWSWLVEGHSRVFAETFQGDRDRRRTVQGNLAAGVAWNTGQGTVRALAGLGGDARRESTDSGALLRLAADTEGTLGTVDWQGLGDVSAENLDTRRNRGATLDFRLNTDPRAPSRDEAGLSLAYQREDLYLDPSSRQLERRMESRVDLSNSLISRPLSWSETRLDTRIWRLDQSRLPLALPGSVTPSLSQPTRDSRHEDLGFEASLGQRAWLGQVEGELSFSLVRQRQDSRYRSPGEALQTTNSRILANRLQTRLAWQPGADSLGLEAGLELRRRDTDQQRGELARDEDYTDRLQLDLQAAWRRSFSPLATVWIRAGLARQGEQHLQASRSAGNHENRRWLLDFRHRLGRSGDWVLEGSTRTLAAYRLFQYESPAEPRSTLQRRWILEEKLASGPLPLLGRVTRLAGWRERLSLQAALVLEDGGRYDREQHLELLSDSANERTLGLSWELARRAWTLSPGWRWFSHREYEWQLEEGQRRRFQRRDLFRRGPELVVGYRQRGLEGQLRVFSEGVADGPSRARNLWASLEFRLNR